MKCRWKFKCDLRNTWISFCDSCCCDNMCSMKEQCSANTKVHKTKFGYILAHSELKVLNSPKVWKNWLSNSPLRCLIQKNIHISLSRFDQHRNISTSFSFVWKFEMITKFSYNFLYKRLKKLRENGRCQIKFKWKITVLIFKLSQPPGQPLGNQCNYGLVM